MEDPARTQTCRQQKPQMRGSCVGLKSSRHFRPEVRINPIVRVRKKGALRLQRFKFSSYSFWPDHLTHACDVGTGMAFYRSARETDDYRSNHQDVAPSAGDGPGVRPYVTNAGGHSLRQCCLRSEPPPELPFKGKGSHPLLHHRQQPGMMPSQRGEFPEHIRNKKTFVKIFFLYHRHTREDRQLTPQTGR